MTPFRSRAEERFTRIVTRFSRIGWLCGGGRCAETPAPRQRSWDLTTPFLCQWHFPSHQEGRPKNRQSWVQQWFVRREEWDAVQRRGGIGPWPRASKLRFMRVRRVVARVGWPEVPARAIAGGVWQAIGAGRKGRGVGVGMVPCWIADGALVPAWQAL
jgi:hypothetical protein